MSFHFPGATPIRDIALYGVAISRKTEIFPNLVWCIIYRDKSFTRGRVDSLWELMSFEIRSDAIRFMRGLITGPDPIYTLTTVDIFQRKLGFGEGGYIS